MIDSKDKLLKKYAFAAYDFSNSGYVFIFQSFLFPLFVTRLIGQASNGATLLIGEIWGWAISVSVLIACFLAPILGKIGDATKKSNIFGLLVILVGAIAMITPWLFENHILLLIACFIVFNALFELSQSMYNSFINLFAKTDDEANRLSAFAWGFGYLGGVFFILVYFVLNKLNISNSIILSFCAVLYLLISSFSIIVFKKSENKKDIIENDIIEKASFFNSVFKKHIKVFIIYWVIIACVAAITSHFIVFAKTELMISETRIIALTLGAYLLAFPLTIASGMLAARFSASGVIRVSLIVWLISVVGMYFSHNFFHLVIAAVLMASVFGSTQALIRSHYSMFCTDENSGEGFGYFAIINKSASIVSPAAIALIVRYTNEIRPSFLFLAGLLIAAIYLTKHLKQQSREDNLVDKHVSYDS